MSGIKTGVILCHVFTSISGVQELGLYLKSYYSFCEHPRKRIFAPSLVHRNQKNFLTILLIPEQCLKQNYPFHRSRWKQHGKTSKLPKPSGAPGRDNLSMAMPNTNAL
jgi:hypothetical protein